MAAYAAAPPPLLVRGLSAHSNPHGGSATRPRLFLGASKPSLLSLRAPPCRPSTVAFARRKNDSSSTARKEPSKQKTALKVDDGEGDDIDEDAFEALFSQLEEDLKNDNLSDGDVDYEITEEDLARLEQELVDALGGEDQDEISEAPSLSLDAEVDEEEKLPELKNWQLRRLARALKIGRRKTSIKNLVGELGLDRALVLQLLRDPPPSLLVLSDSLPDEVTEVPPEPENKPMESPSITTGNIVEDKPKAGIPVHVMRTRWSMQKRLKKVQVETLERVYSRTKRPTNAMIGSIVHVTNLPRKRVVQWFEERRLEDGVPEQRVPFHRSMPETISTRLSTKAATTG